MSRKVKKLQAETKTAGNMVLHACLILSSFLCTVPCCFSQEGAKQNFDEGVNNYNKQYYEKALFFLDRTVDEDPTNSNYHLWRGKCLKQLGRQQDAVAEFKLSAMLAPDARQKEACRLELYALKQPLPAGSINDPGKFHSASGSQAKSSASNSDKVFKLSSKKLDWNLEMSKDFLQNMQAKNARLESLARSGGRWSAPGLNSGIDLRSIMQGGPAHAAQPLTVDERQYLSHSDIMIILDHSGSMQTADCPSSSGGLESRLRWCLEELLGFSDNLLSCLPHGFHLISFDEKPDVYKITSAAKMREVLQGLRSGGGTNLAAALKEAFRLHASHPQEPLLIAVVTDAEVEMRTSEATIISGTRLFPLPNGVFINILQVGITAEVHTRNNLRELDNLHTQAAAPYDAVEGIPFSRLRKDGLARDLLAALRANSISNSTSVKVTKPATAPPQTSAAAASKGSQRVPTQAAPQIIQPPSRSKP